MRLILTHAAEGCSLRYRDDERPDADEIIATFPTADEAWAALKAARRAAFNLRSLLNV